MRAATLMRVPLSQCALTRSASPRSRPFLRSSQSTLLCLTQKALLSTMDAAGKEPEPTPTCLVSICLGASRDGAACDTADEAGAANVFSEIAAKVFRQIGAPTRRALIYKVIPSGVNFTSKFFSAPVKIGPTEERMEHMLELFLETAAEISEERIAKGLRAETATVVLLWDEVSPRHHGASYAAADGLRLQLRA